MEANIVYWGYIQVMEKKMEATMAPCLEHASAALTCHGTVSVLSDGPSI